MATTPQKNSVPPPAPEGNLVKHGEHAEHPKLHPGQTIGVKGEPIDDGERDPDTIAEEQRARSDEMEKAGMAKWIADHDERKRDGAEPKKVTATVQIESHKAP